MKLSRRGPEDNKVIDCGNHMHLGLRGIGAVVGVVDCNLIRGLGMPLFIECSRLQSDAVLADLRDPDNEPSIIAFASNLIEEVEL